MMKLKLAFFGLFLAFTAKTEAKNMIRVKAIGSSPRGQFVAFEEFGYVNDSKTPFARIRVKNVWKNTYVDQTVQLMDDEMKLEQIRAKVKKLAIQRLKQFNIST